MATNTPQYPLLAIDTSSRRAWIGLKTAPEALLSLSATSDPTRSLFELVERVLEQGRLKLADVASIVYCEGPGSMLGARTAVMAIRSWEGIGIPAARILFTYRSLALGQQIVARSAFADSKCLIVTDARRNSWNALPFPAVSTAPNMILVDNEELEREQRTLVTFPEFMRWTKTAAELNELSYDPESTFSTDRFLEIIRPVTVAAPLSVRESDFKKWIPKIHTATDL